MVVTQAKHASPGQRHLPVVSGIAVRLGDDEAVAHLDPTTSRMSIYLDGEPVTGSIAAVDEGFIELGERLEGVNQVVAIRRDDGMRIEGVVYGKPHRHRRQRVRGPVRRGQRAVG